ncbi:MAG: DeoR family transcriptional regulator [bacterium]|nr:DeoR family transcriptional regulator [bacterium]
MDSKKNGFTQSVILKDVINPAFYSFFKDNFHFIFCYRKATKLLKAIYIITDNLKDEEALTMRQLAKDIVKDTIVYFGQNKVIYKESLHQHIFFIVSLFEAFTSAGLVSSMNAIIITTEYQRILEVIEESDNYGKRISSVPELNESMFDLSQVPPASSSGPFSAGFLGGQSKGHKRQGISAGFKKDMSFKTSKNHSDAHLGLNIKGLKDKAFIKSRGTRSERELLIIKEIKQKGSVTVKDIAVLIKGVSEKTIQRELVSLLAGGVLKREGERRWSRYFLAS